MEVECEVHFRDVRFQKCKCRDSFLIDRCLAQLKAASESTYMCDGLCCDVQLLLYCYSSCVYTVSYMM
jgi:hypothetical protein